MKKFFGKLPVMITFIALAVIMTVAYIGLLVRPVAIGFTYKGEIEHPMTSEKVDVSVKFKSGKKAEMKIEGEESEEIYYFEKDGYVVFLDIENKDDYKDAKEEYIEHWDEVKVMVETMGLGGKDCNAFNAIVMGQELQCTGSIVFAVVGGIVELVLLAGAGLSVFYFIKKKKA